MKKTILILSGFLLIFYFCKKEPVEKKQIQQIPQEKPNIKITFVLKRPHYNQSNGSVEAIIDTSVKYKYLYWKTYHGNSIYYDSIFKTKKTDVHSGPCFFTLVTYDSTYRDTVFLCSLDTIKPKEYLPVYPGSYWVYDDHDTVFTSSDYIKNLLDGTISHMTILITSQYFQQTQFMFPYIMDLQYLSIVT